MDFLKGAMEQYQNSHRRDEDEEHDNDVKQALSSEIHPAAEADIHDAKNAHEKVYRQGSEASDEELGKAAGVQAFTAYEEAERSGESSGGQGQLVQMAMAEAMKLFSGKGGASSGSDKSAVVQSAIAMAMKLFASKGGEGGSGSGSSNLLGMLTKAAENPQVAGMLGKATENPQVANMLKKFM